MINFVIKSSHIKAAIFDMDGTIISSTHAWDDIISSFVGKNNIDLFRDLRSTVGGKGMLQNCNTLREYFNIQLSDDVITQMFSDKAREVFNRKEVQFIEGFEYFHEKLVSNNIKTILATNAPAYALDILDKRFNLKNFFGERIYNSCMVDNVFKPNPKLLYHAMELNNINPEECIIFEDSIQGISAAKSAKINMIIGVNSHNNLFELTGSDKIINNYII